MKRLFAVLVLMSACESEPAAPTGAGAPTGLAVVNSDFKSVSVSLVDPTTGAMVRDACLSSGTQAPQLTAALSGDVVLPSTPQPGNELVLIDRTNSTLTWVDPRTCGVLRQLNVGEGSPVNPHDVAAVSATKAYVTRYDDKASDLLVIDPAAAKILGRIDLRPYATKSGSGKEVFPKPERAAMVGGRLYVVLNNLSAKAEDGGPGRVVAVDPATDTVTAMIDLPGLFNCGSLSRVGSNALVVSCGGLFSSGPKQIDESGAAWIDLGASPPSVKTVAAKAFGRALSWFSIVALSQQQAFAITLGEFKGPPPDQVWSFDFAGGAPKKIYEGSGGFVINELALDTGRKRLFVPDANDKMPQLHVFDLSNPATPTLMGSVSTSAAGLPPRYVSLY